MIQYTFLIDHDNVSDARRIALLHDIARHTFIMSNDIDIEGGTSYVCIEHDEQKIDIVRDIIKRHAMTIIDESQCDDDDD